MFIFARYCYVISIVVVVINTSSSNVQKSQQSRSSPTLGIIRFLTFTNKMGMKWHLILALICDSLLTLIADHFCTVFPRMCFFLCEIPVHVFRSSIGLLILFFIEEKFRLESQRQFKERGQLLRSNKNLNFRE